MDLDFIFFFELYDPKTLDKFKTDITNIGGQVVWTRTVTPVDIILLVVFDKGVDQDDTVKKLRELGNKFYVEIFY